MIVRDPVIHAILQHPLDQNSGGDSSRSSGLMALFGSMIDQNAVTHFEKPPGSGLLCRHPLYYTDDDFTRDQLLCLSAGLWACKTDQSKAIMKRVFWSHAKRGFFCQNYRTQFTRVDKGFWGRDPLSPSHIGHLILCARIYWLYPVLPFCYLWLIIDIIWATKIKPEIEQNQTVSMCAVYDMLWLWAFLHPNWKKAVLSYFSNWRDQIEIGETMIQGIEKSLFD